MSPNVTNISLTFYKRQKYTRRKIKLDQYFLEL